MCYDIYENATEREKHWIQMFLLWKVSKISAPVNYEQYSDVKGCLHGQ